MKQTGHVLFQAVDGASQSQFGSSWDDHKKREREREREWDRVFCGVGGVC